MTVKLVKEKYKAKEDHQFVDRRSIAKWLCRTYAMMTICFCPLRRILKMRLFHWMSTFVCGLQWRLRHLLPMMVISLSQVIFLCGITGSQLMPAGKVKFKGVQRLKLCEINKLRQNYLSAHQIVSDLFSKGGKIPEDIDHLLNMIKFNFEKRDLYHIHASLVPIANMTLLLKLMYDHLKFAIRDTVRYTILLQLPYVTDWPTRIVLNMLLMHSYNFIRGLYEVPLDEPGQTELNEKQISALKMLGLAVVPGQRSLTQFQQRVIKASKFMDFLRNRTSHRMDALNVFASYSPEGSELSSYVCYPLILPHLQDALYDANELSKLDMKSLF